MEAGPTARVEAGLAARAEAGTDARVVVVATAGDAALDASLDANAGRLRAALTLRGVRVVLADALVDPTATGAAIESVPACALEQRLAAAGAAFEALQPDEARARIAALLDPVDEDAARCLTSALLERALLLDARAALARGDSAAAATSLDRALAAHPELALDPVRYPPAFRAVLEARRSARAAHAPAVLVMHGLPEGATLAIDGAPPNSTQMRTLPPGQHRLRLEAQGHIASTEDIALPPGTTDLTRQLTWAPPAPPPTLEALEARARAEGATLLVVSAERDPTGHVVLVVRDRASARVVRLATATLDDAQAARVAASLLDSPLDAPRPPQRPPQRSAEAAPRALWPYVLVGAGIVLAGTAVAIGVAVASDTPAPTTFTLSRSR